MTIARRIVLAARPSGNAQPDDFRIETIELAEPDEGELLVATQWISVDPMIALLIGEAPLGGTIPALPIGAPIPGAAVSRVLASRASGFAAGDLVEGRSGWQDHAVVAASGMHKIDPRYGREALGVLGLPGFTAWLGLDLAGDLAGKTVLVSGAAGAVGGVAGQLAKRRGARVLGFGGSEERRTWLTEELGFDRALDHRAAETWELDGIDLYFDNVGGELLQAVLPSLNRNALVLVCGLMSSYSGQGGASDSALLNAVMAKSLRIAGFNNREHLARFPAFETEMLGLLEAGAIKERYHETVGLEGVIEQMAEMFTSHALGKRIARIG